MLSLSMHMRRLRAVVAIGLTLLALLATTARAASPPPRLDATTTEPRAFGWQIGDIVERSVTVQAGNGLVLEGASLPRAGVRGSALELRSVSRRSSAESGGRREELMLRYQVFLSPSASRVLEMPAFKLRFTGQPREQEIRIEAWPVTVSPLTPVDPEMRRGLGELRPDAAPMLIDTAPARLGLMVCGGALLLLIAYLVHVYIGLPWWNRSHRPFTSAWRGLRRSTSASPQAQQQRAFKAIHEALNRTWGAVLFESGIDPFLASHPRFKPLRSDLVVFFGKSRAAHFIGSAPSDQDQAWLVEFCWCCRDAERGAA
ncbi:MAG: hypothetical protein ABI212_15085 [Burkholderiaceae bacterium]